MYYYVERTTYNRAGGQGRRGSLGARNKYPNAAHPNSHGSLVKFLVTDDRSVSE